ncbi:hypothetical protein [Thalassotalea piscium]
MKTMEIELPDNKIYLLKHKLFSDVVKLSVSHQNKHEFINALSSNSSPLTQFELVFKIRCENAPSVIENIEHSLKSQLTYGGLYQVSTKKAIQVLRREANRIPIVHTE